MVLTTFFAPQFLSLVCKHSIYASMSHSDWKSETGKTDSCAVAMSICGPCISPGVGPLLLDPGYMMEHVMPQHSFNRVKPVLVKGEEVCWALDGTRLVSMPEVQGKKHTVRKTWSILRNMHLFHLKFNRLMIYIWHLKYSLSTTIYYLKFISILLWIS